MDQLIAYLEAEIKQWQEVIDQLEDYASVDDACGYHNAIGSRDALQAALAKVKEITD